MAPVDLGWRQSEWSQLPHVRQRQLLSPACTALLFPFSFDYSIRKMEEKKNKKQKQRTQKSVAKNVEIREQTFDYSIFQSPSLQTTITIFS
jgi:hypothetical protein